MEHHDHKGVGCMLNDGSMLSRVTAGVTIVIIVAMLGFGMSLYAGQEDRYTGSEAKTDRAEMLNYIEDHYTTKEVAKIHYDSLKEQLDRMELKIDRLEEMERREQRER